MLVEKSCVELLRSCGINILVVFFDIPAFCLDYKLYLPLKTFELATKGQLEKSRISRRCRDKVTADCARSTVIVKIIFDQTTMAQEQKYLQ